MQYLTNIINNLTDKKYNIKQEQELIDLTEFNKELIIDNEKKYKLIKGLTDKHKNLSNLYILLINKNEELTDKNKELTDKNKELTIQLDNLCVICYENKINYSITPCGHVFSCEKCIEKINKCSICRIPILNKHKIFI
jgi:hypothetical protein